MADKPKKISNVSFHIFKIDLRRTSTPCALPFSVRYILPARFGIRTGGRGKLISSSRSPWRIAELIISCGYVNPGARLTRWRQNRMAVYWQTTFQNYFLCFDWNFTEVFSWEFSWIEVRVLAWYRTRIVDQIHWYRQATSWPGSHLNIKTVFPCISFPL